MIFFQKNSDEHDLDEAGLTQKLPSILIIKLNTPHTKKNEK